MPLDKAILIGGVVTVIIGGIAGLAVIERRRKKQIIASLEGLGLTCTLSGVPHAGIDVHSTLGPFGRLLSKRGGIQWSAAGTIAGRQVVVAEHRYTTGHGKNRRVVHHTLATTPCPHAWPALSVTAEHFFHKIAELLGSKDIKVEDPAFNSRWRVKGDSEDFTILVLSPVVQEFCQRLPSGVWMEIGRGALCLAARRRLDGRCAADMAQRVAELSTLLPSELEAWHPQSAGQ